MKFLKALIIFVMSISVVAFRAHAAPKTCLNRSQIIVQLQRMAQEAGYPYAIKLSDSSRVTGILGAVSWDRLDRAPAFRKAGLALGPNDIRYVHTVNELIGVIQWGLCTSKR